MKQRRILRTLKKSAITGVIKPQFTTKIGFNYAERTRKERDKAQISTVPFGEY